MQPRIARIPAGKSASRPCSFDPAYRACRRNRYRRCLHGFENTIEDRKQFRALGRAFRSDRYFTEQVLPEFDACMQPEVQQPEGTRWKASNRAWTWQPTKKWTPTEAVRERDEGGRLQVRTWDFTLRFCLTLIYVYHIVAYAFPLNSRGLSDPCRRRIRPRFRTDDPAEIP